MLPGKVCGCAAGEVGELVLLAAEDPERVAGFVVDEGEDGEVAGGDEVVALFCLFFLHGVEMLVGDSVWFVSGKREGREGCLSACLLDGVDVKKVEARIRAHAVCVGILGIRLINGKVLGGVPVKDQLARRQVNLLKAAVHEQRVLGPTDGPAVKGDVEVGREDDGAGVCDAELVHVGHCVVEALGGDVVAQGIRLVKEEAVAVCVAAGVAALPEGEVAGAVDEVGA